MSLPPIDAAAPPTASANAADPRSPARQAEIERDLDALHAQLGVPRGGNLFRDTLRPKLDVPVPVPGGRAVPLEEAVRAARQAADASAAAAAPAIPAVSAALVAAAPVAAAPAAVANLPVSSSPATRDAPSAVPRAASTDPAADPSADSDSDADSDADNTRYARVDYWDARFSTEAHYEWLCSYDHVAAYFARDFPLRAHAHARILVLGCGNSPFSRELADAGYLDITSCDFSRVVIDRMRAAHAATHPRLKWVVADVRDMRAQFPDEGQFDLVIDKACLDALVCDEGPDPWQPHGETVRNMRAALGEAARLCGSRRSDGGGAFLSIGFQQPHFRKKYLLGQHVVEGDGEGEGAKGPGGAHAAAPSRFGWEGPGGITVSKIDAGLGYFYTLCRYAELREEDVEAEANASSGGSSDVSDSDSSS